MRLLTSLMAGVVVAGLLVSGCTQATPAPAPTVKPAAAPTAAPAAAPTKAPSPPTAVPAAQPTAVAKKVEYPEKGKSITLIVPYAAGSAADLIVRVLAPMLEKQLGTAVPVVDREGAGSQVGMTELAQAKPDGYTLSQASIPSFFSTYLDPDRKAVYSRASFIPVAAYGVDIYGVAVKADSAYKTLKDLVDAAKANPDKIKMGVGGGKSSWAHLSVLMLEKVGGVKFATVILDSAAPATTTLLGGHVDAVLTNPVAFKPYLKEGGELRLLAVMGEQESKMFPGVKTMVEAGYNVREGVSYQTLNAPAGTPKEVVDILSSAVKKVLDTDEYQKQIGQLGSTSLYKNPAEIASLWIELENKMKEFLPLAAQQQ